MISRSLLRVTGFGLVVRVWREQGRREAGEGGEMRRKVARTDDRHAAGWSFVMERYALIERWATRTWARMGRAAGGSDELINETIVGIVDGFTFDPERGSAGGYIRWQIMAAAKRLWRKQSDEGRACSTYFGPDMGEAGADEGEVQGRPPRGRGGRPLSVDLFLVEQGRVEDAAEAAIALGRLSVEEREAVEVKLLGLTADEIQARYGVSMAAQKQRIYRARARMGIEACA